MKLFGSIKELVSTVFRKDGKEVTFTVGSQGGTATSRTFQLPAVTTNSNFTKTLAISGEIVDADIAAGAAIADSKLATISTAGKVANSATTADSANTINAIVARDASGNFSAGTITAAFSGALNGTVGASTPNTGAFTTLSSTQGANLATSSGNVGIGTSSPGTKLMVSQGSNGLPATSGTTQTYGGLRVRGGDNSVLDFGSNSADGNWIQSTDLAGLNNSYPLLLNPNGGNVGIGNATPAYPLDIHNDSNAAIKVGTSAAAKGALYLGNSAHGVERGATGYGANDVQIKTAGGGKVIITPTTGVDAAVFTDSGNVGIGTSSPSEKLTIALDGSGQNHLSIKGATNANKSLLLGYNTTDNYGAVSAVIAGVGPSALALNKDGGNVGIGKTNPSTALDVNGTVTATSFTGPSTAVNGLLPSQSGYANKYLKTDGSTVSWASASGGSGEINAILNSSGADGVTGWVAGTSHNTPVAFSGVNNPLDGIVPTAFSFTATAGTASASSGQSGIGIYDDMTLPTALQNRKLKIEFAYSTPASSAGTWAVVLYQGTTRVALSTDSSGDTVLPAGVTGGKFTAYFDSTNASAYRLLLVQRTRTSANNLYLTNIIVGPGIQPQGAVVGEWTSYTPTTPWSNTTVTGRYRRVGDSIEIRVDYSFTGAPSIGPTIDASTLLSPLNLTIDNTKFPNTTDARIAAGTWTALDSGVNGQFGGHLAYNGTGLEVGYPTGSNSAVAISTVLPFTWGANDNLSIQTTLPVSQWAGSGTVQLAQNDVEYASVGGTWDGNSSTTVYGPGGATTGGLLGASRTKVITWQRPIQPGDNIQLEFSADGVEWSTASGYRFGTSTICPLIGGNAYNYGVGITSNTSTTTTVFFGQYAGPAGTWDGVGRDWPSGLYWRVRKSSAGAAVGFGIVQPGTSAGLVSASGLPGNTTGNAIASGYVGELQEQSWSGVTVNTTSTTLCNLTVSAGVYMVAVNAYGNKGSSTGITGVIAGTTATISITLGDSGAYRTTVDSGASWTSTYFCRVTVGGNIALTATSSGTSVTSHSGKVQFVRIA